MTYRLRDWRPVLFIALLVMMAVHQTNEIAVLLNRGAEAALAGIGEYPETATNLLASLGTVLLLRWVDQEQTLARPSEERVQERTEEIIPSAPNRYPEAARKDLSGLCRPHRSEAEVNNEPVYLV